MPRVTRGQNYRLDLSAIPQRYDRRVPIVGGVELRQLRYFAAVAQEQSVTVAAARLRISQSALSSAVAQLEAAMGTALFRRVPRRGVELTESGLRLLHESLPLLEAAEELPARVRQDHQALPRRR